MIARLHHMAFRCRDSEETRAFYEEVVGLPFTHALEINTTKTGREAKVLHTFFGMDDGSSIAFFEEPGEPFDFKEQRDFDLHIALEADQAAVDRATKIAKERGLEFRGPSDHGFIRSIYLRDPNGYVVELTVKTPRHDAIVAEEKARARDILRRWTAEKG
jgi:catechol 2,3-dioxygenase-like lactoylglutathione lyase family enzyme